MKNKVLFLAKTGFVFFGVFIVLLLGFKFCKTRTAKNEGIKPPSEIADITYEIFSINNDSSSIINTRTGSVYNFEKNALVYKNGNPAHGLVTVKIREFHTALDIMRSGIPMRTRRNQRDFLESAGMVEIRAYKDTTELMLDAKTGLKTDLAAFKSASQYQLFTLNENSEWEKKDTFDIRPNDNKKRKLSVLLKKLDDLIKGKKKDLEFELYSDISTTTEMKPWLGQRWKISKEEVTDELLKMMRVNWDSVSIKTISRQKLKYELKFTKVQYNYRNQQNVVTRYTVFASPVKKGYSQKEILGEMDQRIASADSIQKEIEDEIVRVKQEAEFISSFNMTKLGIWNIDRLSKQEGTVYVDVKFDFQSKLASFNNVRVFCLYEEDNSTLEFGQNLDQQLLLRANKPMKIISFLPNHIVGVVEFDQIKSKLSTGQKSLFFQTKLLSISDFIKQYNTVKP